MYKTADHKNLKYMLNEINNVKKIHPKVVT